MPDDSPLKVGDFVVIRGERLGRIERVESDGYAVRALMAHRRWAVHTSTRPREELEVADHDYVRAKLGLEIGAAPSASPAAAQPTVTQPASSVEETPRSRRPTHGRRWRSRSSLAPGVLARPSTPQPGGHLR